MEGNSERTICTMEDRPLLLTVAADRALFREDDVLALLAEWHTLSR